MRTYNDEHPPCNDCGGTTNYVYIPSVPYVSFKDGPSGSWPSKGDRFKKHREQASADAARRQRDRYGEMKGAVPNFNGQETESWREAQSLAIKEKGLEVAPTFEKKITEENNQKLIK
jgi:hypothetical protein